MKIRIMRFTQVCVCCLFYIAWLVFPVIGQEVTIIKNTLVGRIGEAQVELLCPDSVRLLIDVADPESLTKPVTSNDILLTTHLHNDHFIKEFADAFPGKQLRMERGEIVLPKVLIKSIPASHSTAWPTETSADNYIIIVEIGDLRIAHLGDLEQKTLMPEQLKELEGIDVVIAMLYYPSVIDIINQINPRIILPTHIWGSPIMKSLVQHWPAYRMKQNSLKVEVDSLPNETTLLLIGDWGERLGSMYKVPEWQ